MPYNLPMARARWRWWRYVAQGLVVLVGLVGIGLLIWRVPPALYAYVPDPKDRAAAEASTRTGLLAGLAGLGALGSLAIATRTYRLTQQGQITDRYTKAIEELGSDKLDVRLGGIYALERIAADSERDHPTVVEVLSAFAREHSHPTQTTAPDPVIAEVLAGPLRGRSEPAEVHQPSPDRSGDNGPNESAPPPKPTTDVQAAVTVLGRLPQRAGISRGDLSEAHLPGAVLAEANLSGAQLNGVNLSGAQLNGVNLSGAHLDGATLSDALLAEANLSHAVLVMANLSGAWLKGATLSDALLNGTTLSDAHLAEANLSRAMLYKVDLSGAWLEGANLSAAQLGSAYLSGVQLKGVDLSGAQLDGATLSGARLAGANLSGAHLDGANLSAAWLSGADLRGILGLTEEQLKMAYGDADTRLPDGLQRPAGWP